MADAASADSETSRSDDRYDVLFDAALSSQNGGDYEAAIAYYTEAVELNPRAAAAYVNRGVAYESTGDLDRALRDYGKALGLEPKPEAYHNRGNVHFKRGEYDRAVRDYGKALELDAG